MPLAIDNYVGLSGAASANGAVSLTFSHEVIAGSLLIVAVVVGGSEGCVINSVTYNGDTMSLAVDRAVSGDTLGKVALYYLAIPDAGTHDVVITTDDANTGAIIGSAISLLGADLANPIVGTPTEADGATEPSTVTMSGTTAGNLLFGVWGSGTAISNHSHSLITRRDVSNALNINNLNFVMGHGGGDIPFIAMTSNDTYAFVGIEIKRATAEQEGYRWRDDNGSESGASWLDSQDTDITRNPTTNTRLRAIVNTAHKIEARGYGIEYRKVGDTNWHKIGTQG
jgi:hypothetical protein